MRRKLNPVSVWLVLGLVWSVALPPLGGMAMPQSAASPVADLLNRYAAADYDGALAPVSGLADVQAVYDGLATSGSQWIAAGGDAAGLPKRRLIAASFALEAAARNARKGMTGSPGRGRADVAAVDATLESMFLDLYLRQMLVAWGGAALTTAAPIYPRYADWKRDRRVPPLAPPDATLPVQPAECSWFAAAVSLLEFPNPSSVAELPSDTFSGAMATWAPRTYLLVPLAEKRCPGDPRWRMASAAVEEYYAMIGSVVAEPLPLRPLLADPARVSEASYQLGRRALAHYEALTKASAVAAEAHMRAGYLQIRFGDHGGARRHFAEADRLTTDSSVHYVSRMLTGTAWQTDRHASEAEAAYRAALEAVPHARSASTLLAALLAARGEHAEATSLLESAGKTTDDPWGFRFMQASAGMFPEALVHVRALLR